VKKDQIEAGCEACDDGGVAEFMRKVDARLAAAPASAPVAMRMFLLSSDQPNGYGRMTTYGFDRYVGKNLQWQNFKIEYLNHVGVAMNAICCAIEELGMKDELRDAPVGYRVEFGIDVGDYLHSKYGDDGDLEVEQFPIALRVDDQFIEVLPGEGEYLMARVIDDWFKDEFIAHKYSVHGCPCEECKSKRASGAANRPDPNRN
jgi:hypothetical protein